ncbi:tuberin isoform X2 [Pectinophora gossypiella]|uniref:tuberin isoform X2 n=1 Tax=Pectinophora gossypiella TaxID=13191 RepID=UPI00214F0A8A|nr:tuberin isoform X2 [Pectinophora gossypiella]
MGSRDRDTKSLQDKLKVFFKKAGVPARSELSITAELERELSADVPLHRRLRAVRDLADKALQLRIQDGGVERIWRATRDLLEAESVEARHAALALLRALAEGQAERLSIMRTVLFRFLRESHANRAPDDAPLRFKLLHTLTNTGKNITCFEEQIGAFLVEWLQQPETPALQVELLQLVTNVVKFNASSLDEDIVHGIVNCACWSLEMGGGGAGGGAGGGPVGAALALLEAVLSYSLLPRAALRTFVCALCRTVNLEAYTQHSWKLMRYVVGGDCGHAALLEMTDVARGAGAAAEGTDAGLVRGAVFYVNMALWGPRRVPALRVSFLAVLPAFLEAVELRAPVVTYEVLQALQVLVTRAPQELHEPAWDMVLRILHAVLAGAEAGERNELIQARLHAVLTGVEQLALAGQYAGSLDALLDLLDRCGHERPEASAMWLVSTRAAALSPWRAEWAQAALALHDKYLRHEPRLPVRLHTLDALLAFIMRYKLTYGEELVERVGAPVVASCALDAEPAVRAAAARAAAELARAVSSDVCADLVDLLQKILDRPFEMYVTDVPIPADADVSDLRLAARALVELVHDKLLRAPAAHAARAVLVLLDHLEQHYRRPALFLHHPDVRLQILELVFALRSNAFQCVGLAGGRRPLSAPALVCSAAALAARGPAAALLPAARLARALERALGREADWAVLGAVLRALPALLAGRALCVGRRAAELDQLAGTLCSMLSDRSLNFPDCLRVPAPHKLSLSEFQSAALPPLAALAPYHAWLEPHTQQRIVRCLLKFGMVLRTPQPYMSALTVFTLETRETMVKMLPEVLLDLSKISDTKLIAAPMLEFLSTLTRLPRVFSSFVEDQYMSVFAILLPYTNPSRYNHYVVSLAHHVIAAWFLKCRPCYRRNFVRFIIHGLHNYIILPFEERLQRPAPANEDSSNRQRSSSLGSRAVSRAPLGQRPAGPRGAAAASGPASAAFHVELTETCVDLLARYAFTPCAVKPHRGDLAEFMFHGGHSATWLVGHKLVTITTSGCLQNSIKQGLCDRCATLCRQHAAAPPQQPQQPQQQPQQPQQAQQSEVSASGAVGADAGGADVRRQNSGEGKTGERDPVAEVLSQFTQRLERVAREVDGEEGWARVGELAAAGACPCWCARWAEVHVRAPTGDTAWVTRLQNRAAPLERDDALQELAALLLPAAAPPPAGPPPAAPPAAPAPAPAAPPPAPARLGTQPINIPGSPQRQSSSSTTDDDDMLIIAPSGKSRHPVRRSNSSPEMSSWKLAAREAPAEDEAPPEAPPPPQPSVGKKAPKKPDMRVSCEAIPEEMSGTSPLTQPPHPHLMTYNSDPGEGAAPSGADGLPAAGWRSGAEPGAELAGPAERAHHQLQKTASDSTVGSGAGAGAAGAGALDRDDLPPLARSKRSNTISVMSPTRRHRSVARLQPRGGGAPGAAADVQCVRRDAAAGGGGGGGGGGGLTPAFVFLQLYHNMSTYPITPPVPGEAPPLPSPLAERPLRVAGVQHERSIKNLDLVPPLETYKVGVLYVGPGQADDEVAFLRNECGSVRYADFLTQLGTLVSLDQGADQPDLFLNLEKGGKDGHYTYVWTDDVMQVQFHVATAMPTSAKDPNCNEKRKYIGNDYVSIVYNDSGADFNITTIKGQLNFCIVVVEPLEHGMNRVFIKTKDERIRSKFLAHHDAQCVSDPNVALLARQVALHCSLASQISQSLKLGGAPYASNALERLRLIKRLRRRVEAERLAAAARAPEPYAGGPDLQQRVAIDDFNDYT